MNVRRLLERRPRPERMTRFEIQGIWPLYHGYGPARYGDEGTKHCYIEGHEVFFDLPPDPKPTRIEGFKERRLWVGMRCQYCAEMRMAHLPFRHAADLREYAPWELVTAWLAREATGYCTWSTDGFGASRSDRVKDDWSHPIWRLPGEWRMRHSAS